jgi:probable lipoprotein NlpC
MSRYAFFIILFFLFFQSCRFSKSPLRFSKTNHESNIFNEAELNQILHEAYSYLGVPYRLGGIDKYGVDCSGLLFSIYQKGFFLIPRTTSQQLEFGLPVSLNQIKRGDWVFFSNESSLVNHVGIVSDIKNNSILFLHASTSKGVRKDELTKGYWHNVFIKAIRPFKRALF